MPVDQSKNVAGWQVHPRRTSNPAAMPLQELLLLLCIDTGPLGRACASGTRWTSVDQGSTCCRKVTWTWLPLQGPLSSRFWQILMAYRSWNSRDARKREVGCGIAKWPSDFSINLRISRLWVSKWQNSRRTIIGESMRALLVVVIYRNWDILHVYC